MKKLLILIVFTSMNTMAQTFDWQGHRGARGLMPENSIPAFEKALELGVVTLELDVVISGDKQVVVSHDPYFSPDFCVNPKGMNISNDSKYDNILYQMTYNEISEFDCGSIGNPRFPDQIKMKTNKPLLVDVFKMAEKYCKDFNRNEIRYNIEIKSQPEWIGKYQPTHLEFCELVFNTIDAYVPWSRVTIQSFDFEILRIFHKKYPRVQLAALEEKNPNPEKVLEELGFFPQIYSPFYEFVKQKNVKWLHENNIRIIPWTVNDPSDMLNLIEMGVDGIITDYPNFIPQIRN